MRTSLALLAFAVLVPSTALADDDTKPADTQPTETKPVEAKPVATAPMPRVVEASSSDAADLDGYVAPHFVPY